MQVVQHQSPTYRWQIGSISPQESAQITKNIKRIEKLPTNINFNVILLDQNEITKLEHLDIYPQLIQVGK
jgi:hypothetical protein